MEPHFPDADDSDLGSDSELDALLEEVARPSGPRAMGSSGQLPDVGDVLDGRFRIERVLGRGGMGLVYESTNLRTQARVALKWMLPYGDDRDAEMAVRFRREACAAASIRHRNVVEVYDVAGPDGSLFLVMELLRGEGLRSRIKRQPLSLPEAIEVMRGVLTGVAAAHKAGIVHRDLKPDNIFLCTGEGGVEVPKVLDFGVAALQRTVDSSAGLTRSGAVVGTPMYMAPEQFKGADVDERTDVYALGVVLYEMLSGHLPFAASTGPAIAILQATTKPTPLWAYRPELPKAVHELVARALERSPADRFQTAEQFLAALAALPSQAAQPEPTAIWRAMAIGVALALAVSALYFGVRRADHAELAPSKPPVTARPVEAPVAIVEKPALPEVKPAPASTPREVPAPPAVRRSRQAKPQKPDAKPRPATSLQLDDFKD